MKIGSYFPNRSQSTFYAMGADDCSLHFDLESLTEKQWLDHLANVELTALLQVATIAISKRADYLGLYDAFGQPPWDSVLKRYCEQFEACGIDIIPLEHFVFARKMDFYQDVATRLPDTELLSLYMTSGSNAILHKDEKAYEVSRNLNSKFHFAQHAPGFGINTPPTLTTTKAGLGEAVVQSFYEQHADADGAVMLKLLGLAGSRNVTAVTSVQAAQDYVAQYVDDMPVLLQKKLDLSAYQEMTVDLLVSEEEIRIANVRQILFADGLWVGNFVSDRHQITPPQQHKLLQVGEYVREHGYATAPGSNCGMDYFVGPDDELIVTEINARWTGGLLPMQALERVNNAQQDAVFCFDRVPADAMHDYLDFSQAHLPGVSRHGFSGVALGFSPFEHVVNGVSYVYVWQMVIGDFYQFRAAKNAALGPHVLPTIELITLPSG